MDWIANNLYWTDTLNRRLEVLDLDSTHKTELLQAGPHAAPRAIAVDPSTRYFTIFMHHLFFNRSFNTN